MFGLATGRAVRVGCSTGWAGDRVYRIEEEVIGLGSYGRTLTVLTCGQLSTDWDLVEDDEDDEEKLVKSWTPRFRR